VLERLREGPIPAPSATPPGELTYGEALTLLKFAVLPTPAIWPQAAALLEQAAEGDASALEDIARGYASEEFHRGLEPGIAILCADSPARRHARAWPHVVHRLQAISRIGAAPQGWAVGAPCASWPARPGRYLVDLTTPARGTVCPSDRLPFDPDFGVRRSP
jgi:hypothetical protein